MREARVPLVLLVVLGVLVSAGSPMLTDAAWRTAVRELADPAPAPAAPDGPVLVLGGSDARLPYALHAVADDRGPGVPSASRPLWLSAGTGEQWEASGRSCTEPHVVCFTPDPASTYGEALAVRHLAADRPEGTVVTVVTSQFHVARTRWQFAACAGVPTVVVAPGAPPAAGDRTSGELVKLVNAGLRTACRGERTRTLTRTPVGAAS